ncbi:MAG: alpha-galactosidase [Planctomycetota bacterium]
MRRPNNPRDQSILALAGTEELSEFVGWNLGIEYMMMRFMRIPTGPRSFDRMSFSLLARIGLGIILLSAMFACTSSAPTAALDDGSWRASQPIQINVADIKVVGDLGVFRVNKSMAETTKGVQVVTFRFTADVASELKPVSIRFDFPSIDIIGYWNPKAEIDKVSYYKSGVSSKASSNAPVLAFHNAALDNRMTISLSDALNKSEIVCYLKEEDVHFHSDIRLFQEKMPKTKSYEIKLRIDNRALPFHESIDAVASWWAEDLRYTPMQVPDAAKEPMYSTWYSYHQSISAAEIIAECKIAKSLGCGAVIVDDGWQTKDGNRGYAYTGDWNPDRIPNMRGFVDGVHAEGMKFLLWYSLPFMGEKAKNYERFKGKYLSHWRSQGTYILDPRYPEVREYIVGTYVKAIQDWNLDGFKLDFIGSFRAAGDTILTKEDGRDFASVNNATDFLMTEITNRLTALKPDILIEFRQPYIGPLMRKYGNMFRGVDAPNNAVANRVEVTTLRIMAQETAVHSDMFIWRKEESAEGAALQILNILYSVPQLSVRLAEIPDDHRAMIANWFSFWNEYRDVLLGGEFIPSSPGANYPQLTAIKGNHQITTVYDQVVARIRKEAQFFHVVNATSSIQVVIDLEDDLFGTLITTNCMGEVVSRLRVDFYAGVHALQIPRSGMVEFVSNLN